MRTKKLEQAAYVLAEIADCHPQLIINAVELGRVNYSGVYQLLSHFGYTWNGVYWSRRLPAWLKKIKGGE